MAELTIKTKFLNFRNPQFTGFQCDFNKANFTNYSNTTAKMHCHDSSNDPGLIKNPLAKIPDDST